ncbi:tyrosine-type recombinase/integrase [Actinomadura violacea]|uniref:Tyrosine-type recombinase/integrase n=1 Tax=Actinomadura violacea TaxID=2819934 RepID=A0ABS3RXG7_9ACTN|nr:tyrosine-type recombinase/integrase [Actinomadura violacea]MBO2461459.1 tyrosine-type recombinase/integrase [Actinomadura violacea]
MTDLVASPAPPPEPRSEPLQGQVVPAAPPGGRGAAPDLARFVRARVPADGDADAAYLAALAADVAGYLAAAHAPATRSKYAHGWAEFEGFCARFGLPVGVPARPTEVEVVALYLAELGRTGIAMRTVAQRIAAIRYKHGEAGLPTPTDHPWIRQISRGMRRTHGVHATGKDAVSLPLLAAMVGARPVPPRPHPAARAAVRRAYLIALRDRCLLLLGFFAGVRRTEFTGIRVDDLELLEQGLRITLGHSKTDQEGAGRTIDIPYAPAELTWLCPVRATLAWLEAADRRRHLARRRRVRTGQAAPPLLSGITNGGNVRATALSERYVATTVKDAAADAGQPDEVVDALAAHSLRAGISTAARAADVDEPRVGRLLGHTGTTTGIYNRPHWDGRLHEILYTWILAHPTLSGLPERSTQQGG